jgi:hypothetical protein
MLDFEEAGAILMRREVVSCLGPSAIAQGAYFDVARGREIPETKILLPAYNEFRFRFIGLRDSALLLYSEEPKK